MNKKVPFTGWLLKFAVVGIIFNISSLSHAFEAPEVLESRIESMPLPILNQMVPADKIRVIREKLDIEKYLKPMLPEKADDGHRLTVELVGLTRAECDTLKAAYAGNRSLVNCALVSPSSVLRLTQFLEPAIQATDGKTYPPENSLLSRHATRDEWDWPTYPEGYREESDSDGNPLFRYYDSQTNCWGVAWEVARKATDAFHVYVGDLEKVMEYMFSDQNSETIVPDQEDPSAFSKRLGNVQYGDILVINYFGFTKHMATFIDSELLFERTGNEAMYLNRLISLSEILARYPEDMTYRVIRPRHAFPVMTEITNIERTSFGPESDDYEGLGHVTYYNSPSYDLVADDKNFVYRLGTKRNAVQSQTIERIDQILAESQPDLERKLYEIVSKDEKVAATLSADQIDSLVTRLISDRDGLSTKQILLRGITMDIDHNPVP